MTAQDARTPHRVIVAGAGATGLALAYLLSRQGCRVVLLEAAKRPGGLLTAFDVGDGHLLEHFYHYFFTHDAELHWLFRELGLEQNVRIYRETMGFYLDGRVHRFNGLRDLLTLQPLSRTARTRFGLSSALLSFWPRYTQDEDTAALEWFQRWAGDEATRKIWSPMLRTKFGSGADRISLAWMAGRMRQRVRSGAGTHGRLGYVLGSFQLVVDRLVDVLQRNGVELRLDTRISALKYSGERVTGAATTAGDFDADAVVATMPTPVLEQLVQPIAPAYARCLSSIGYVGAICTILTLSRPLSPVYWLNVADDGFDFGGVIEHTRLVGADMYGGRHIVYLSKYLQPTDALWSMSDDAITARHLEQLQHMFPGSDKSITSARTIRGRYAAPFCDLGFARRIPTWRSPLEGLFVASMCHVHPDERSVNNSIRVAAEVGAEMGFDTSAVPRNMSLAATYGRTQAEAL